MGKHASFHFRPQKQPAITHAPLTAENCTALADELEVVQTEIGQAVDALRALAAGGGEGAAPLLVRSQAHQSLYAMAEALQRAPDLLARVLQGR